MHELENRPVTRINPRRSYLPWIAMAVAMAMLMAGCGSSPEAGVLNQLRVVDVATRAVTLLAEADGPDTLEVVDFSLEGDRIHFSRLKDGQIGVGSLWSVKADGSDLRRLAAATAWGDWVSPGPTP